ncbi:MAG: rod shape-determining protein MreD [Syntrophales bacterium]|nr:rod shape-determining protein MreD [Syntrophales bacterium]MDD5233732.1 rod shape-determining protein MreD [Syntrophales bacterium]MDD5531506.1 rod shape-determining protein MreD [Syntrophales bacterium]
MIFYLVLPFFALVFLVFQTMILDLFFLGKMSLEISLILVIFAGFYMDAMRGGIMAFVLGFLLDCITGSITGIFAFYYVSVFFVSRIVSNRVYAESVFFIGLFTFFCVLCEGLLVTLIYRFIHGVDISFHLFRVYLPQAIVAGVLSPAFFTFFSRFEVLRDVGES